MEDAGQNHADNRLPFNLAKFFSYISLVLILGSSVILALFIGRTMTSTMIESQQEYALLLADNMNRQIFRKFEVDTISEAVAYAENNYFSSGERHRYFKLKERKDTDGLGLFGGKYRRSSFDVFTESVLGLIRSVIGHG